MLSIFENELHELQKPQNRAYTKEESLQRIANSLERLEIILRQLGGEKIRLVVSDVLNQSLPAIAEEDLSNTKVFMRTRRKVNK